MSLMSRLVARLYKLPKAETYDIEVEKALAIPMHDGVSLRADRYFVRGKESTPMVLVRTPYGRGGYGFMGRILAERGLQAVIQSCRGSDDSEGKATPFRGEREDGLATLAWLKKQPWFDGRLGMLGPSYLGFTQWAIAREASPMLKAFSTHVTSSEFHTVIHPRGTFLLDTFLQWLQLTQSMARSPWGAIFDAFSAGRKLKKAVYTLPLREADVVALGEVSQTWRDWVEHPAPDDAFWASEDFHKEVGEITAPNHLISGWYDIMLPQLLRDFRALQREKRSPYLTIGPWSHSSTGLQSEATRASLDWMQAHLCGKKDVLRKLPVRIYVTGAEEWREMERWPPRETHEQRWYLHAKESLSTKTPEDTPPSTYRYDPQDPTPNVGGAINGVMGRGTGPQDNRKLEARADVLVFTSAILEEPLEVVGPIRAELYIQTDVPCTDFFVRLCDVLPTGKSMNLCDGILRIKLDSSDDMEHKARQIRIEMWPTAHHFARGHRLRVQVSSGAFPRYARSLGTCESIAEGVRFQVAEQRIFHDVMCPSAIILPVLSK